MFKMKRHRVYTPFPFSDGLNSGFPTFLCRTNKKTAKTSGTPVFVPVQYVFCHALLNFQFSRGFVCVFFFLISFGEVNVSKKM